MTTSDPEFEARLEQLGRFFMGTSDVHHALERLTRKLEELAIPYAVCGGMAVNAHGYERTTTDVDVLLTAAGLAKFKAHALGLRWIEKFAGSRGVRDAERRVPIDFLLAGGIPGDGVPRGVEFPDPAVAAIEINGKRFLTLARLIEMKLAAGLSLPQRLQDHADVIALIRANHLGEHFAADLHTFVHERYIELWRSARMRDPQAE